MNDSAIYKTLKYFKKDSEVTSTELLKHRYFRKNGFSALNSRLSELQSYGYLSGKMKKDKNGNDVIFVQIMDPGLNFLKDYRYSLQLKNRERIVTFLFGLASGYILTYVFPWLHSFLP